MRKYFIMLLTIILIVSSFQAIGTQKDNNEQDSHIESSCSFTQVSITKDKRYTEINLHGASQYISEPGSPQLPVYKKLFVLPGKVGNVIVHCDLFKQSTYQITQKIMPEPQTIYRGITDQIHASPQYVENPVIYETDTYYPSNQYDYWIRCGLDDEGNQVTYVTVELHPIQYNPVKNTIRQFSEAKVTVDFDSPIPKESSSETDTYDLVIIAPEEFLDELQSFVNHKISIGVSTLLKTKEEILSSYSGRDPPEKIKYFIKDAKENWETSFVLLVGGLKSYLYAKDKDGQSYGSRDWHVPVRYANIREGTETSCISDLYYADLYRYNEDLGQWEFEDWDSNGDGVFAKWGFFSNDKDTLDLAPDIYVGRLPCRNTIELNIICEKIINYESTSPDEKPWYNRFIGITGKNFDMWKGQPDGEYLVDRAIENMTSRIEEVVRVYASNVQTGQGPIPDTEDIVEEFSQGAGFIDFEGHGNPVVWDTIHADGEYEDHDWVGGIRIPDFLKLSNKEKLPVVMVGGCHNGLFNVSMLRILLTRADHNYYWTSMPTPLCFCWAMVVKPAGGAIASIGATGLGPASSENPLSLQGAIDNCFFYVVGQHNVEKLGEGHSGAITKYVTETTMKQRETFTAIITQLFGDPSLQFGGYLS